MTIWPLKFRDAGAGQLFFADDAGGFFLGDRSFLDRYAAGRLSEADEAFLQANGHVFQEQGDADWLGFAYRWAARQAAQRALDYLILVPTLRCNLTCDYCQVSRAPEAAPGFDWTQDTLEHVLRIIGTMAGPRVKIEFQGGEPLLRVDLLERVRSYTRAAFPGSIFVVCTNLQRLGQREWAFLDAEDTFVSTSLDGDPSTQERQRTHNRAATEAFLANLTEAVRRLGARKVSALPTIDIDRPPPFDALVDSFERHGMRSIYLRPINQQGFARRRKGDPNAVARWNSFHAAFIDYLIDRNHRTGHYIEEYYFTQSLRRFLRSGVDEHVDLRNPNFFACDYLVVDHDGQIYPTDEARMLSRIGRVDLSVGHVATGLDGDKIRLLNQASLNNYEPDCLHCAYQPFCGSDIVDDLSRSGRVDGPRSDTWFCGRHMALFDKIVEVVQRGDEPARNSVAKWACVPSWGDHMVPRLA